MPLALFWDCIRGNNQKIYVQGYPHQHEQGKRWKLKTVRVCMPQSRRLTKITSWKMRNAENY